MSSVILLDFQLLQFPYVETADDIMWNGMCTRAAPPPPRNVCRHRLRYSVIITFIGKEIILAAPLN